MAKILVADDNSNIQKMVVLALKDQGIDVVAVGNGEAAVRKISDVKPDLVLADVFMPVRNGYEVCQYVKGDSSLAHIPVILLVGAFDPLDEQEAQRVGADGVLKKPFVPPDPLISMVKSALTRAGVPYGEASAPKTPEPEPLKATDLLARRGAPVPALGPVAVHEVSAEPILANDSQSFVDELPVRPDPIRIDSSSHPVAFGSLLETPANEPEEEDDDAFLPPANPELATERDWRDVDGEEEVEEEEEKPASTWRREETESYAESGSQGSAADWRTGSFEQMKAKRSQYAAWESGQEEPTVAEAAKTPQEISRGMKEIPQTPPVDSGTVTQVPAAPVPANSWPPAVKTSSQQESSTKTATAFEEVVHTPSRGQGASEMAGVSAPETKQAQSEQKSSAGSWFSTNTSPWDAEMQKANRLASSWDSPASSPGTPPASNGTGQAAAGVSDAAKTVIQEATLPVVTMKAIREKAAQVAENAAHAVEQQTSGGTSFYAHQEPAEAPASTPTTSMDELVARVLAKMSPDVLQRVTREILKPVVEAMVKEELKGKQS